MIKHTKKSITEIKESEMEYIGPINLNYDLLKQAWSLENSTQNNRNLWTASWKKLPWKLGQLRSMP